MELLAGMTLRDRPKAMQGQQGSAKAMRPLILLGKNQGGKWVAMPTSSSWACLGWQQPIQNGHKSEWADPEGWTLHYRKESYWAPNRRVLLTDDEVMDLIHTYGRVNQAPKRVYDHAVAEYKYAVQNGLLDNRKFFSQASRLG